MPGSSETEGGISAGTGSSSGAGSSQPVVDLVLSTQAVASLDDSPTVQLFSSPKGKRTGVLIRHCGGTSIAYVGFTSDVSANKFVYALVADDPMIYINAGPAVTLYVVGEALKTCNLCCHEVRIK